MQHIVYPAAGGGSISGGATESTLAAFSAKLPMTLVSTLNSTTTPLTTGASWTGTGEDVSKFGVISVALVSNAASVSLGLEFQFSHDNVTWFTTDSYLYSSVNNVKNYSLAPIFKYFRAHYTNDGSPQTYFTLETTYRQSYVKPSSHRIGDTISSEDDAELVTAQIVGRTTAGGGSWVNIKADPSGALTVASTTSNGALQTTQSLIYARQSGSLLSGITWDYFSASFPTSTQEVYQYYSGGSGGTLVATITVNYTDSTKETVQNAGRT